MQIKMFWGHFKLRTINGDFPKWLMNFAEVITHHLKLKSIFLVTWWPLKLKKWTPVYHNTQYIFLISHYDECLSYQKNQFKEFLQSFTIFFLFFFFLSGFSFTDTDNSQDSRGREGTIFYSTLLLPPAHEHSDIFYNFEREMTITYF